MIVNRVEQHLISQRHKMYDFVNEMCLKSKNLYNYANYIMRQEYIATQQIISYNDFFKICKNSDCYLQIGSNTGQATLRMLDKVWKSFLVSVRDWTKYPHK